MTPSHLPILLRPDDRLYAVTFLLPQGWVVEPAYQIEADDHREAIAKACKARWWQCPMLGLTPIGARVRYEAPNPSGGCNRLTSTRQPGTYGRQYRRDALFVPSREDLAGHELEDPGNWRQA